ncbi:sensor histidine kinase [Gorillibacterium massiliense]|uniref:sensor histidine kinase n=1 Tax=Gorillibacterium massiliense TaxID=1280390 RepID=UPI001EE31A98|nr:histidine kinase [Gorillibacterium massiliense]
MGGLEAKRGVMEARGWDFHRKGNILLNGEWEFYCGQLLSPEDFRNGHAPKPAYIHVPAAWVSRMDADEPAGHGYATYRLILHIQPDPDMYGMKITNIQTSNRLYINGDLLGERGKPSTSKATYQPTNLPYTTYFSVDQGDLEIIIQVANYDNFSLGIISPLYFGLQNDITQLQAVRYGMNMVHFLTLFVFAIYHLFIYCIKKAPRGYLHVGLFFLFFSFVLMLWDEKLVMQFYPSIPFGITGVLQSLSLMLTVPFLAMFIRSLDHQLMPRWLFWIATRPAMVLVICALVFSYGIYVKVAVPLFWLTYVTFIICVLFRVTRLYRHKLLLKIRKNELLLLYGSLCSLLLFLIGVYLHNFSILRTDLLDSISFTALIALLGLTLSANFSNTYEQNEKLSEQLIKREMNYLQVQIKPHFLHNTIDTVTSLCRTDNQKAAELLTDFSRYLRLTFDTNEEESYVTVERELELVKAYAAIEQARFGEGIFIGYDVDPALYSYCIPPLCIQPLVENAIRHGLGGREEGGRIFVGLCKVQDRLQIIVRDDGVGISPERLSQLTGSKWTGPGIGIQNVQRRISTLQDAALTIKSGSEQGTEVVITLPLIAKREGVPAKTGDNWW